MSTSTAQYIFPPLSTPTPHHVRRIGSLVIPSEYHRAHDSLPITHVLVAIVMKRGVSNESLHDATQPAEWANLLGQSRLPGADFALELFRVPVSREDYWAQS